LWGNRHEPVFVCGVHQPGVDHVDLVALLIAGQTDREGKGLGAVRRRQEVGIGAVHATDADDAIHDASERIGGWIPTGCEETVGSRTC